jgi:hypothetical protein
MKKRNNSADTTYLFRDGRPAEFYYTIHGVPHPAVTDRLKRLANLEESDWYFNRAITWIFEAFDYKFFKPDYVRDDEYWFKAAFAKLVVYRKAKNINRLEERGIITAPSEAQAILLSIRECDTLPLMKKRVLPLFSEYRKNSNAWWNYFGNEEDGADMASRRKASAKAAKAYDSACKIQHTLSADTFACIQAAYQARTT